MSDSDATRISSVAFICEETGLLLLVNHSYMGGRDGQTALTYRIGDAEARTVDARLVGSNTGSSVSLEPAQLDALLVSPRLAVRLTDPLDGETRQVAWSDIAGTEEALPRLHCL